MATLASRAAGAALIGVSLFILRHYRRQRAVLAASEQWPTVRGKVRESSIHKHPGGSARYSARIEYTFEVDGTTYASKTINFGGEIRSARARAQKLCEKYPVGAEVAVFYDPADPSQCCLQRIHEAGFVELIGGVFGLLMGMVLLLGIVPP